MDTLATLTRARSVTVKHIEIFVKNFIGISEMKNGLFQQVFFITNIYTLFTNDYTSRHFHNRKRNN